MSSGRTAARLAGAVLLLALAPGCALVTPAPPPPLKEVLAKTPAPVPQGETRAAVLVVLPVQGAALYETTRIAYRLRPYEVASFARHEWAEPPSRMLQPLIVKTLHASRCCSAVVAAPYVGPGGWLLRSELQELIADFTLEPAAVQLSLHFVLSNADAGRIVATRDITVREPMASQSPEAAVAAANEAVAKALLELAGFVIDQAGRPR